MKCIGFAVLLMIAAAFAQERYSRSDLGQMEASESLDVKTQPAARHGLGETASHFETAEPAIVDKKSRVSCLNRDNKRKRCAEILREGNGTVRFINGGVLSEEATGPVVYHFYTAYRFENGMLAEIDVSTDNEFSQVVNDFSARFGKPSKTWDESAQNAMGAKFDLRNASWELPDNAGALATETVVFVVPPSWDRSGKMPKGYVHITNAVIASVAALAKTHSSDEHVKF